MPHQATPSTVSVVIVNYQGAEDTITCLRAFDTVDWPADRLQLVVVDNCPGCDDAARIRAAVPHALVIESPVNGGFTGGCNLGVAHSSGDYVGFINNDARPDAQWVAAAAAVLDHDESIGAVACKVLDWDGQHIDYVDGSMTWYGMGYKREVERPDTGEWDTPKDVLFGTGAAMFVRRELFTEVGGFDERFFMFYEDVDLGWRLNLLGHRVRYVPGSLAYHRHHVTMKKFGQWREDYLLERNALMTLYKNYDDASLAAVLPAALMLAVRRGLARSGDDPGVLDLQRGSSGAAQEADDQVTVAKATLAPAYAIDSLLEHLATLAETRRELQAVRRRTDSDLVPLFRQMIEPAIPEPRYLAGHETLLAAFDIVETFSSRRRIVIVTGEPLQAKMAGPAIRAWEIAAALSVEHDVQLLTLGTCAISDPRFATAAVTGRDLRKAEQWCDVLLFQGLVMAAHNWLVDSTKVLIADVYDPFHLEQLEQAKDKGEAERRQIVRDCTHALNDQLSRADFMLCASDKQRDFWLGQLSGMGRLNPDTYDADETLEKLLAVVPFGVADDPPQHTRAAIKGVVPGIDEGDQVILWGGGIYNWFDPLTLIHAIDRLRHTHPRVRLFFLGLKHPNPDVPAMRMGAAAVELAAELGLTGRYVFFNSDWVDYSDRQNYLLEADIGVSTHLQHVETQFSFRTRLLDYLWAGLPIVATEGDTFGEVIPRHGLGLTVPPQDVDALVEALEKLLTDRELYDSCVEAIARYVPGATWSAALRPLVEFCRNPRRAPDLVEVLGAAPLHAPGTFHAGYTPSLRGDAALLKTYFREGGLTEVARRAGGRVRRRVQERSDR